jgi:hypothetical protein
LAIADCGLAIADWRLTQWTGRLRSELLIAEWLIVEWLIVEWLIVEWLIVEWLIVDLPDAHWGLASLNQQ